jgi:hypothetical protein
MTYLIFLLTSRYEGSFTVYIIDRILFAVAAHLPFYLALPEKMTDKFCYECTATFTSLAANREPIVFCSYQSLAVCRDRNDSSQAECNHRAI